MKLGLGDYLRAAFSARPIGMLVPPNWIGLGLVGLLGLVSPGFLVLGAGLELGYLYLMVTSPRFRRTVEGRRLLEAQRQWQSRLDAVLGHLGAPEQARYRALEARCRSILEQQGGDGTSLGLRAQGEGLGRLLWIYLRLLWTRQSIQRVREESVAADGKPDAVEERVRQLQAQATDERLGGDLRKSLAGRIEILQMRLQKRREAEGKIEFLDSELARIEQQVELIREQAVLTTDPEVVSQRIDEIAATLGGTTQWIRDQQRIYGQVEDLLDEPPPLAAPAAEAQQESS